MRASAAAADDKDADNDDDIVELKFKPTNQYI